MKNKICSIPHFERLCKSFSKKFFENVVENKHQNKLFDRYHDSFFNFYYGYPDDIDGKFFRLIHQLIGSFKRNSYKTKSGFVIGDLFNIVKDSQDSSEVPSIDFHEVKIWISYTIENKFGFRVKTNSNFEDNFLVFRVFIKIDNHRKKRIYKWGVKTDWYKL
jgi:hypothetical protein